MPRLFYAGALLAVASLLSAPISAQTSAPNRAPNGARVQHVIVRGSGSAMEVEIQTSGALKGIRTGLFFDNPPITRIVLDLLEPQSYQISTIPNAIVVKLNSVKPGPVSAAGAKSPAVPAVPAAKLQNAALATDTPAAVSNVAAAQVSAAVANAVANTTAPLVPAVSAAAPKALVTVTFENGMLRIHAEKATLSEVLFEVQRQTQAEIAIPAGAEQEEEVVADLGPAPARDVLAALLNGSAYNFIFVGNELTLERVILTRRDSSIF